MKEILYAKPDQTYQQHIEAVYKAWKQTISANKFLIQRMADKYNFKLERFLAGSLLTIVFHDIGKLNETFQDIMTAIREDHGYNLKNNYRHELISFIIVLSYFKLLKKMGDLSLVPIEALAVAGHHKPLNVDLTSFDKEKICERPPKILTNGMIEAFSLAQEIFNKENIGLPEFPLNLSMLSELNYVAQLKKLLQEGYLSKLLEKEGDNQKIRNLFWMIKGILHYADWYGSSDSSDINYSINANYQDIIAKLKQRCELKNINFAGLREFQQQVASTSGHVIAIAPTGSGKTEASILWALKNSQEMGGVKIIYLLPTMATANSIWVRLSEFFGKENVGLTHSSANMFFKDEMEKEDVEQLTSRNYLFDQSFIRPVTVATVDQLLTAGFNTGRWVLKELNAANAVIILDEVHAYDDWTLGLIISMIRHFSDLGTRFLLMSATMPNKLIQIFSKELGAVKVIKDTQLLNKCRSKYYLKDCYIEEDVKSIEKAVHEKRKVLVVVNTVEKCQHLAEKLKHLNPVCYHSRFIYRDRKIIEEKIEEAHFVIATQVVEVSLDIDFDWLFTECAPPDALAQRAGRVNRYRDPTRDSRIIIYRAGKKSEKLYNPINDSVLLDRTFNNFVRFDNKFVTEENLLDTIENVYSGISIEDQQAYKEAIDQYNNAQEKRLFILDDRLKEDEVEKTRLNKYETISVIPYCFFDEIMRIGPDNRRWYEVKIPYWYFMNNKKIINGIMFCDLKYDKFLGVILKSDDSHSII